MRIGINPQKLEKKIELTTYHRIIVVVFIPELKGFYEKSFEVFKLCINSLISSVHNKTAITIVNNGSCSEVSSFLNEYLRLNKIDTLIHHSINIGKIDAMIGAARGVREKLITLSDSDILFKGEWQKNVEDVFTKFNNVGSVSPIPVRQTEYYGTSSTLKQILLKKIKFNRVAIPENFDDYNKYLQSINWNLEVDPLVKWPVISNNGFKAVLGSGHQVLTIDRDILFTTVPTFASLTLVGGSSEYDYVDIPIDRANKLRLSTYNNYAYHMGNTPEKWMEDIVFENKNSRSTSDLFLSDIEKTRYFFNKTISYKFYRFKSRLIKKMFKKVC
jgi:hypothetical protein